MPLKRFVAFIKNALFISPWPYRLTRILLGLVFVYAGLIKLLDPKAFARSISGYGLVPESLLPVVAIGLPLLETVAGIGLVFDVAGSLVIILGLLFMFVIVIWYGILNDLNIDCGCFSPEEVAGRNSLILAFYRDLVMIAAGVYLFVARRLRSRISIAVGLRWLNNSIKGGN